ncbi:MAG: Tetratricopeptide repeat-containing protein [Mucilaginibacter sp.]|nr:Tetratricopeptide repeat-containing protein [Mucilaginibacter sp.]
MESLEAEKLLDRFYVEYHNENYSDAIELLKVVQQHEKRNSFWIYSRLSSCYYELRNYDTALSYAEKAYKLMPKSPLVLWDYAGALIMLKKERKAIKLLSRLQAMDDDLTLYGFNMPEKKWMQSLKLDSNFLIGKAYYIIREDQLAKDYFARYLAQRKKELKTIYKKKDALDYLKKMEL